MAYKIRETRLATRDLDGILAYISRDLANPSAAASFVEQIQACYENLTQMPRMYALCRDPRLREKGYRKAVIKNYIMVYRCREQEKSVEILRFFYGRQDYEKLL